MKNVQIINISLVLVIIILAANLLFPVKDSVGKALYSLDTSATKCYFHNAGELNEIPIDRCCLELQKQLSCNSAKTEGFDFRCYTSKLSEKYYLINHKTLNYCKKEGYDVQVN